MRMIIQWMSLILGINLGFVAFLFAKAEGTVLQKTKSIEVKAQIEELISKRYRDQISTQIDSSLFNVSVKVTLREINEVPKTKSAQEQANLPAKVAEVKPVASASQAFEVIPEDLTTGVIELSPVLDHYKRQLEELQAKVNAMQPAQPPQINIMNAPAEMATTRYEIRAVEVSVGLDSGLKSSYRREFEEWLKKTVESDFGQQGSYKISILRKIIKPEEPPKELTPLEKVSNLQILLGFGLLALVLMLGLLFSKLIPSRDIKEQNQVALRIQEMRDAQVANERSSRQSLASSGKKEESETKKAPITSSNLEVVAQTFRETQGKVAILYFGAPAIMAPLFETWYEQGWNGRVKAAAFIDAVLSRSEKVEQSTMRFSEKWRKDSELHQAFREFPGISLEERTLILEEAYWDILSLNMLGKEVLKTRFGLLADLSTDKLQRLLSSQEAKVRALTLMHLPEGKAQDYFLDLDQEEKKNLIENSLQLNFVREDDLAALDENFKLQVQNDQQPEGVVNVSELLPNLLKSLSPREELQWLPEASLKLSDQGLKLKRSYPSLAFLQDWPDEALELFFNGLDSKLAVVYLRLVPAMVNRVPKFYPTRIASIIRDELAVKRAQNEKDIDRGLEQLKLRLLRFTESGEINLERVFKAGSESGAGDYQERRRAS